MNLHTRRHGIDGAHGGPGRNLKSHFCLATDVETKILELIGNFNTNKWVGIIRIITTDVPAVVQKIKVIYWEPKCNIFPNTTDINYPECSSTLS
jgi:hypothetical protein